MAANVAAKINFFTVNIRFDLDFKSNHYRIFLTPLGAQGPRQRAGVRSVTFQCSSETILAAVVFSIRLCERCLNMSSISFSIDAGKVMSTSRL